MPKQTAIIFDPDKTFDDNVDHGPFPQTDQPTYQNSGEPSYTFLGHKLYAPFGIGAGSLPTSKHVAYAFQKGFDVVCYKTQRSVPFKANAFPNVVYLDVRGDLTLEEAQQPQRGYTATDAPVEQLTITNSFGNPSRGPDFWAEDMARAVAAQGEGQLLIASVVGTIQEGFSQSDYYDDFAKTAQLAAQAGAPVIEVNLSCPNVANEGIICYTLDAVLEIGKRTKELLGDTPLIAKLGYFSPAQQELLEQIITEGSQYFSAYSVINTIQAAIVDGEGKQLLPGENRLKSGVCGAGIKWAGLEMVKRLDALRKTNNLDFEIIGIGGVMTPSDYLDYRDAGADVVQSVTAAMWNDNLAAQVKASL